MSESVTKSWLLAAQLCRCQLQTVIPEGGHLKHNTVTCGALVSPKRRLEHLREVHGLDGLASVDRLDEWFTPVDSDQGAETKGEARAPMRERAPEKCSRCNRPARAGRQLCEHHASLNRVWKARHLDRKESGK